MTYVYILSTYVGHGAEDLGWLGVCATMNRDSVEAMLKDNWRAFHEPLPQPITPERLSRNLGDMAEGLEKLRSVLSSSDEDLAAEDGINLSSGWGSIQLHVVKLWEPGRS